MPTLIKLSSDGRFLFYISGFWNTKAILSYNIKTDSAEKIKLDLLDANPKDETEVVDIDSHNNSIQVVLEIRKSKKKNCGSPCSGYSRPTYIIYDITKKKHYSIPIERFFYHITDNFWDIKNNRLYVLTGKRTDDIDQLEVFDYANNIPRTLHLNHLKH